MKNVNLQMFNKLIDSTEGLEVTFKVGKECELNVKGDFMAMMKIYGIILEKNRIDSDEQMTKEIREFQDEMNELLQNVKKDRA